VPPATDLPELVAVLSRLADALERQAHLGNVEPLLCREDLAAVLRVAPPPPTFPQSLDSRAVGIAHEMLQKGDPINIAEVARRLGVDRTKLYRCCPGFQRVVEVDRQSNRDRKAGFRRGSKDRETGRIECADDD
jgi:hypothetical protein